jgi:V/A-type H+-transporting ATPase subunit I
MIVPMKKVAVIVQAKDADAAVKDLRSLGLLHVEHGQAPQGKDLSFLSDDISLVNEAITILSEDKFLSRAPTAKNLKPADWRFRAKHIIELHKRLDQLEEYSRALINRISQWQAWGDFDPEAIRALEKENIFIRFYQVPVKELKDFPEGVIVKNLFTRAGTAHCAVISREKTDIPFKELSPPKLSLEKMRARLYEDGRMMGLITEELLQSVGFREAFISVRHSLQKELELHEALRGMAQAGGITYISGYIPKDSAEVLSAAAKKEKWGIVIKDPAEEDRVPTLIRNPRWISVISPVFKLIEVVPGYHELDISLWFLVFLSVFFGMLIGDAGYGLLFMGLTFIFQRKLGRKASSRAVFALSYVLCLCAIGWGVLSGTFFGQAWLPHSFKPLLPELRDDKSVQTICFFIGALHLSIGHLWRALLKSPALTALADIGWVVILWGAFFLAKMLILGEAMPPFAVWLYIAGPLLVLLFTSPNRNILKGLGAGLGNLLLNVVNSFTDLVSYIRLFAVGLATVAVADAANQMAMSAGFNSIVSGLLAAVILFIGHGLNLMLGPIAILVHGVRLNVLEFCNHIDIKWTGLSYRPLKEEAGPAVTG